MKSYNEYRNYIASAACVVSSPHNGAVFYSDDAHFENGCIGEHYNRDRADALIAKREGSFERLETTPGGQFLDDEKLYEKFSSAEADALFKQASKKYAAEASGDAQTRVVGANEKSIFRSTELPTLLNNEKVDSINGVPREEIKQIYDDPQRGPEAAFNRVCEGELARDRAAARASGDSDALSVRPTSS